MIQYIDKAILLAEIEKRCKQYANERNTIIKNNENRHVLLGRIKMCDDILSFIDTLKTKDVNLDLEITLWANAIPEIQLDDIERLAKYFYELGLKAK